MGFAEVPAVSRAGKETMRFPCGKCRTFTVKGEASVAEVKSERGDRFPQLCHRLRRLKRNRFPEEMLLADRQRLLHGYCVNGIGFNLFAGPI